MSQFGYPGGLSIDSILNVSATTVKVPTEFHSRCRAIKNIYDNDYSGMITSILDFMISSATVELQLESSSSDFNKILKTWLEEINIEYKGRLPFGIKSLQEEFYKETWKYSSFPVFYVAEWKKYSKYYLPSKLLLLDGSSIYAIEKNKEPYLYLGENYDYYLGKEEKFNLNNDPNVIFAKNNSRFYEEYPIPFLIQRGIYYHFLIIKALKDQQTKALSRAFPFLMHVKKGTEGIDLAGKFKFTDQDAKDMKDQIELLSKELYELSSNLRASTHISAYDTEIKYIIPDLMPLFNSKLFETADRSILSGFGLIDIVDAVSTSRRESVLNPKAFISEVNKGIGSFKSFMTQIMYISKEYNISQNNRTFTNIDVKVLAPNSNVFMTESFKEILRQLYDRGLIQKQTAIELIGEQSFEIELLRAEQENKMKLEEKLYPPVIRNDEGKSIDERPKNLKKDTDPESIPEDKTNPVEKKEYDKGSLILEESPYGSIKELPEYVQQKFSKEDQNKWMDIWNTAYNYAIKIGKTNKKAEQYAFRVANSRVRVKGDSK